MAKNSQTIKCLTFREVTHTKKNYIYHWHEGGGSFKHKGREQQKLHKHCTALSWASCWSHTEGARGFWNGPRGTKDTPKKGESKTYSWTEAWNMSAYKWLSGYVLSFEVRVPPAPAPSESLHNCEHLSGPIDLSFPLQAPCTTGAEQKDPLLAIALALLPSPWGWQQPSATTLPRKVNRMATPN